MKKSIQEDLRVNLLSGEKYSTHTTRRTLPQISAIVYSTVWYLRIILLKDIMK